MKEIEIRKYSFVRENRISLAFIILCTAAGIMMLLEKSYGIAGFNFLAAVMNCVAIYIKSPWGVIRILKNELEKYEKDSF